MAPTNTDKVRKSWSEINKSRKEDRKKWREQSLFKKKLKQASDKQKTDKIDTIQSEDGIITKSNSSYSTISIAVPGSILENAQSPQLRTYLAGQIARAACIFQVDEIVVFDDYGDEANCEKSTIEHETGLVSARKSCIQLCRILQYLECPQYLRRYLFPIHPDLNYCGILNPLQAPHHLGPKEEFTYREGVVANKPVKNDKGSHVNVGLLKEALVDKLLRPGLRCTVKLLPQQEGSNKLKGSVVPPSAPRQDTGTYWGYSVRVATSISKIFSQCPYESGYDLTVGTSDTGNSVDDFECPTFNHMLIVFGGLQGLEAAIENDPVLETEDPHVLFEFYLNTLPQQGSKTIRTEEAILVSLSALRSKLQKKDNQNNVSCK